MTTNTSPDLAQLRQMAEVLDCFIEEDFRALADATAGTVEAWRKRGTGPSYIRLGNRYLYPRPAVAKHLESLTRVRTPSGKAML